MTFNREMPNITSSFVFKILSKINNLEVWLHVITSDVLDPIRHSCRKQANLDIFFWANFMSFAQNFLNIFFEAKFEHDVSFIKYHTFELREVNVTSLNVIKDSTSSSHKQVYSIFKLMSLVLDTNSSIDCNNFELFRRIFQFGELCSDLKS